MKFDATFLRSKVARRISILFICCALLPIAALALISFSHVTKQLNKQSQRRLHQQSKTIGMAIYERLLFLETEMKTVASNVRTSSGVVLHTQSEDFGTHLKQRFKGLVLISDGGKDLALLGRIQNTPKLSPVQKQYVLSGETLVFTKNHADHPPRIFMTMVLDPQHPRGGIILAQINLNYLWFMSYENTLQSMTELCILDSMNNVLFSSLPAPISFPEQVLLKMIRATSGQFEWVHEEQEYLASYWSIFMQSKFLTPKWTVVLSESRADVLAPMANFKKTFPLVTLMSLWVVLLLSISQIRRSLIPLEKLKEGTKRIARRDFRSQVMITSGDEFEELAASFNTMAIRLEKQFSTLTTIAEIDRAILSALDTEKILDVVLTRMHEVLPCDCVSVTLLDSKTQNTARTYIGTGKPDNEKLIETIHLMPNEIQTFRDNPENFLLEAAQDPPHYLAPLIKLGMKSFLILPIFLKQKLSGIITLGYLNPSTHDQEDLAQARQLTDQLAVALSNARLIEELDQLNWGTLTALARAIDAKSPWTAGHSERVTKLALKIARVMGLTHEEIANLHRGGLLHDIGKLGIPPDILDKPRELTESEKQVMREHVRVGARILEPIPAYAEIIPIVLHHHERFDGTGYPDGLAGNAISLGARIFAVADSFDALISNRPYRHSLDVKSAVEVIKQASGRQLDPEVVQAFLEVMAQEGQIGGS